MEITDDELFEMLVGLGVQGERLRVSNRIREAIPLNVRDSMIRDCGVGDMGEHIESGRMRMLRIVRKAFPQRQQEFKDQVDAILTNEGTDKP